MNPAGQQHLPPVPAVDVKGAENGARIGVVELRRSPARALHDLVQTAGWKLAGTHDVPGQDRKDLIVVVHVAATPDREKRCQFRKRDNILRHFQPLPEKTGPSYCPGANVANAKCLYGTPYPQTPVQWFIEPRTLDPEPREIMQEDRYVIVQQQCQP